jgi:DNA-binding Xre family transcriptional regulator
MAYKRNEDGFIVLERKTTYTTSTKVRINIKNCVADKVESYIKENNISKASLAEQIGISRQALNILLKTNNPTIETLIKLAIVMDCEVVGDLIKYEIISE